MGHDKVRSALRGAFNDERNEREEKMVKRQMLWEWRMEPGKTLSEELKEGDIREIAQSKKQQYIYRYLQRELAGIEWKISGLTLPPMDGDNARKIREAMEQMKFMIPTLIAILKKQQN